LLAVSQARYGLTSDFDSQSISPRKPVTGDFGLLQHYLPLPKIKLAIIR